ncbi:uncharacterized protein LOC125659995 isoform X2 [Ostrea edulis]|uniref:uncharacterized protein LOC125659995 isoform X2 n=1 Tax=Ostrea edulis TaxID=37623 RepID=UPI0024AEBAA9|nr:uncharacterized protein LOC125659995 isoform X2 [Ostrea edulis]
MAVSWVLIISCAAIVQGLSLNSAPTVNPVVKDGTPLTFGQQFQYTATDKTDTKTTLSSKVVSTTPSNTVVSPEQCADNQHIQCIRYNKTRLCDKDGMYGPWASKNCRAYCGYCQVLTTTVPCFDVKDNCDEYQSDLCRNNLYRLFRERNCRKFCKICTGDFDSMMIDYPSVVG